LHANSINYPIMDLKEFIRNSIIEDVGSGDHTSLGCIPNDAKSKARLIVKEDGILAGMELAAIITNEIDKSLKFETFLKDGDLVRKGDIAFHLSGKAQSILKAERLVLNCMQRMSGIATTTSKYVKAIEGTYAKVLDTRKTTPLNRYLEKWAVRIGGGHNHRFGLYDMIMIKDNHVDYAGGISKAIHAANDYLTRNNIQIPIEIETRSLEEIKQVLDTGNVQRIMLDNFSPQLLKEGVSLINKKYETEASGGIVLDTIRSYAETGVDFISIGALTHSVKSLDLSLKAF